jgi:hypothetical protein
MRLSRTSAERPRTSPDQREERVRIRGTDSEAMQLRNLPRDGQERCSSEMKPSKRDKRHKRKAKNRCNLDQSSTSGRAKGDDLPCTNTTTVTKQQLENQEKGVDVNI